MGGHLRTSVLTCAHHSPARTPELWGIHRLPETHPFLDEPLPHDGPALAPLSCQREPASSLLGTLSLQILKDDHVSMLQRCLLQIQDSLFLHLRLRRDPRTSLPQVPSWKR